MHGSERDSNGITTQSTSTLNGCVMRMHYGVWSLKRSWLECFATCDIINLIKIVETSLQKWIFIVKFTGGSTVQTLGMIYGVMWVCKSLFKQRLSDTVAVLALFQGLMGLPGPVGMRGYPGVEGPPGLTGIPGLPGKRGRQVINDLMVIIVQYVIFNSVLLLIGYVFKVHRNI